MNSSNVSPFTQATVHTLYVPSSVCTSSGTDCPSVGSPQNQKSCQQTCSSVGSSFSTGTARPVLQH